MAEPLGTLTSTAARSIELLEESIAQKDYANAQAHSRILLGHASKLHARVTAIKEAMEEIEASTK